MFWFQQVFGMHLAAEQIRFNSNLIFEVSLIPGIYLADVVFV